MKTGVKRRTIVARVPTIPFRNGPFIWFLCFAHQFVICTTLKNALFRAAFAVVLADNGNSPNGRSSTRFTVNVTPTLLKRMANDTCPIGVFVIISVKQKKLLEKDEELDCGLIRLDEEVPTAVGRNLSY